LIAGHAVCSGCGSDAMSCTRLSLLTKVTRDPAAMVTVRGDTPLDVIVMVEVPGVGGGEGEGDGEGVGEAGVELLPPHPMPTTSAATQNDEAAFPRRLPVADRSIIRRTSVKY
jgi:hypothetical protein